MNTPFPFDSLLIFGFLSIMLLAGVVLRAKVPVIQRFLFPSCLIGGILGLIIINTDILGFDATGFETFAYHFFNISFISVGLTGSGNRQTGDGNEQTRTGKEFVKGSMWMALVQGISFPLQAIVGIVFVLIFGAMGTNLFKTFGFLAPLGFNEGPGQALSFGKAWEGVGFEHAATIGLTYAAIGFFFSFFVGVPLANWGIRKGISSYGPKKLPQDLLRGIISKDQKREAAGELTLHSGNVDTLAFQAALIGFVYVITYLLVDNIGKQFGADVAKMLWGMFFFFGLGIAVILKLLLARVGIDHLIDPGIQRRITGWSVDFLIVSTIAAIQLIVVWEYVLPIAIISVTNGILTTLIVIYLGKRIWANNLERILAIYGTVTGTVSSGLLLLRIVDPEFKTPVAMEVGMMN
ncbi:MAG: hypothetical protein GY864_07695, partial [Desulfobacterales bacterium]|nr:hypothetical protein [Desulfobacterales bacterium]